MKDVLFILIGLALIGLSVTIKQSAKSQHEAQSVKITKQDSTIQALLSRDTIYGSFLTQQQTYNSMIEVRANLVDSIHNGVIIFNQNILNAKPE